MILRPDYIKAIRPFISKPFVKILVGVRRCGKTTILEMMKNEIANMGISKDNIFAKNYSHINSEDNLTNKSMYNEIKSFVADKGKCYLFLDEVQEVDGWEKVINTLLEEDNCDIYVTGSNSKLMSGEISTYLTGRYVTIPVYTLSYREFLEFKMLDTSFGREKVEDYIRLGGFPIIAISKFDDRSAYQIVEGIYSSVITKDISKRHKINDQELFDRVVRFIVENIGKTFSANSVVKFLKGEKRSFSVETVYNYIKWMAEAFIIYPCKRYDLQGKSVLQTQEKYYLSDVAFKYSQFGFNGKMVASVMENIVFLELKRRGYDVYVGKNGTKEIDFIAEKRDEKLYVQVCRSIPENSTREYDNLMEIRDNYPKYIVTLDSLYCGNENGIKTVHLTDFLLSDEF
ncbi:MAG: ATP-binding protein [Clostridia bacterium]